MMSYAIRNFGKISCRFDRKAYLSLAAGLACATSLSIQGAEQPSSSPAAGVATANSSAPLGISKPNWLTDLSLGVKESYDDNVFFVSGDGAKKESSWITTVSPKLGVNFAPFLGKDSGLQVLALGYAPDIITFHNEPSENYNAHRFSGTLKGKVEAFSFNLENSFNYIDGNTQGHIWAPPDNVESAYAASAVRERREQFQDRSKISLRYDLERWFLRPTASLLFYDLGTDLHAIPGYYNFADRYDVNGGADIGYQIEPQIAATIGYRYGHQYQQQYPLNIDPLKLSASSDYQRVLIGLEGKPWKWLTIALQGGPDFRVYPESTATHVTPVSDKHPIKYYGEGSLTADVSTNDSITFKYKQWQWVSSVGKLPIYESLYDLGYRRKLGDRLTLDLGGRIQSCDYTSGNMPTSMRDDWQYTVSAGFNYAFNQYVSANVNYTIDLGRNAQDDIVNAQYREFDHQLVSLGVQLKF